ncbi:cell division protein ZapA [Savagea sp. SN6]|uniref:Cell division protein ZapA n=1 Tax=Savagea serpentis TaxID=2785297 RepID=A0A8J7G595_9BACL|nr:cell division protein ZapA [Savagea serpentis]MBF4501647.1 cell division protein ZapA [Savagea serpentis]
MADEEKNRVEVDIYGQSYTIVGKESREQMRLVATMVDDKMREIRKVNPALDSTRLAVLTAVNSVNEQVKLKEQIKQLQLQLEQLKG